ncbi:hypothetical protein BDZ85DRAFT_233229 [Elsinoe ampelina]|uniref:Chitin synthesis regulation, resistance to congo red-domain-containing protein n=1 Tax=Elsinoe ampelina TaxID=302913 RepID=A0A6A6GGY0_9PEZI|nr:hypothetical protein BDZ85DRAFT_233229 [Elsinoe ampelina]
MSPLSKRQCTTFDDDGDCYESWWWSDAGLAVRYAVVVIFFLFIIGFLTFSYLHAQRRLRKGLPPLGYHRWLVSRRHHPRYNYENQNAYYQGTNYGGQAYGMQNYQPPPPAYNTWDAPPQYQPPVGRSKALANQNLGPERGDGQGSSSVQEVGVQRPAAAHPGPQTTRDV